MFNACFLISELPRKPLGQSLLRCLLRLHSRGADGDHPEDQKLAKKQHRFRQHKQNVHEVSPKCSNTWSRCHKQNFSTATLLSIPIRCVQDLNTIRGQQDWMFMWIHWAPYGSPPDCSLTLRSSVKGLFYWAKFWAILFAFVFSLEFMTIWTYCVWTIFWRGIFWNWSMHQELKLAKENFSQKSFRIFSILRASSVTKAWPMSFGKLYLCTDTLAR